MTLEHISSNIITDDINLPKYSELRKVAAAEFLDKELKITGIKIISPKMSPTSPILWIEVSNSDIADMLLRQSAKINSDAKAIIYPP